MSFANSATVTNVAPDKGIGLTLDQLAQFVTDCMRRDLPGDSRITVVCGWSAQIQKITAAGDRA